MATVDVLAFLGRRSGLELPSAAVAPTIGATVLAIACIYLILRLLKNGVSVLGGEVNSFSSSAGNKAVAVIQSIGTYVPTGRVTPDYFVQVCASAGFEPETMEKVRKIVKGSGIESRGSICANNPPEEFWSKMETHPAVRGKMWEENSPQMALEAAKAALAAWSQGSTLDITHVVVHSCTGFSAPGLDFHLITELKLPSSTRKVGVNFMGCFGAFTGLYVAKQIIEADASKKAVVLVVCAETCSVHLSKDTRVEMIVGNTLFADGAGAAIITHAGFKGRNNNSSTSSSSTSSSTTTTTTARIVTAPTSTGIDLVASAGEGYSWALGEMLSDICPDSGGAMTWKQSADGGRYDMYLDRSIPKALAGMFASQGLNMLRRVGIFNPWTCAWAIHPGGKGILDIFQSSLRKMGSKAEGIECSYDVLRTNGNMSSPTILFVLQRVLKSTSRNNVFFAGFGPGLTIEYGRLYKVKVGNGENSSRAIQEEVGNTGPSEEDNAAFEAATAANLAAAAADVVTAAATTTSSSSSSISVATVAIDTTNPTVSATSTPSRKAKISHTDGFSGVVVGATGAGASSMVVADDPADAASSTTVSETSSEGDDDHNTNSQRRDKDGGKSSGVASSSSSFTKRKTNRKE